MKKEHLLLALILISAFILRLYRFSSPIADWHSWRQADTSSVSRIFVQEGFDVLRPRFHDLSNVPSGKDNPQGYRFVEFPIYNFIQAGLFSAIGIVTLEEWGRLVTILASLLSIVFVYAIVVRHADKTTGLASAFFMAFLPYSIYYGRVILPDPLMVAATLGGVWFFDLWIEESSNLPSVSRDEGKSQISNQKRRAKNLFLFIVALLLTGSSLLLKPFAVFFLLPIVVLAYNSYGVGLFKKWQLYVFALLSFLPLVWWRTWMLTYPEGIPVNEWLFNGGNIRFKGAYFYWVFADHIGMEILGYAGFGLLLLGIIVVSSSILIKHKKDKAFFLSFLVAALAYLFIIARGNVQHDYYQIPVLPTIVILLGFGASYLLRPKEHFSVIASRIVLFFFVVFTLFFSWYHVRDFFNINNPNIVTAGSVVDKLVPKDAKVITFYGGDTSFLYQTHRSGWASLEKSLPEMIQIGATYLAIVNPTKSDFDGLGTEYPVVASDPKYLILKL